MISASPQISHTGVDDRGLGGRVVGADPTGDSPNSSKSGASIISIGSENVVSSVLVVTGVVVLPCGVFVDGG